MCIMQLYFKISHKNKKMFVICIFRDKYNNLTNYNHIEISQKFNTLQDTCKYIV